MWLCLISFFTHGMIESAHRLCKWFIMPEISAWQIFVSLGVPGLALGVLYMLYRNFKWRFPMVPVGWVGPIVVLFMVLVFFVVLASLILWSPGQPDSGRRTTSLAGRLAEIERTLSLTAFQYLEAMYLNEADRLIDGIADPVMPEPANVRRVKQISEILRITLLKPPASETADHLIERYGRENPRDDPWTDLLVATSFYQHKQYLKCSSTLDGFKHKAQFPGRASARFFQGVCTLRNAREREENDKTASLVLASSQFADAHRLAASSDSGRFRNLAMSSATYFQGVASFYAGDLSKANEFFVKTAETARDEIRSRAFNGVGYIAFIRGEFDRAEAALLLAMEQSPKFPLAQSNYGYVLLALNRIDAAAKVFEAIAGDVPTAVELGKEALPASSH
jgi:tetratricopeptide (TPR) repeat protein